MKKLLLAMIILMSGFVMTANAESRISLGKGYTLVNYGNWSVIENDNLQMSIKVEVKKPSRNIDMYEIFCNNRFIKKATKATLKYGINAAITSTLAPITGVGGAVARAVAGEAVEYFYDSVCEYYK